MGHVVSFLPNDVIYGHTDVHFWIQGLRALSLLPLGPGEQRQSPGTLYFSSSFGQGLRE